MEGASPGRTPPQLETDSHEDKETLKQTIKRTGLPVFEAKHLAKAAGPKRDSL